MFELLQKIRDVETKWTQSHTFKRYQNYYVPEKLVKNAKRVISFGVGTDVRFEKLMCSDNNKLDVRLFDPTPITVMCSERILYMSGLRQIKRLMLEDISKVNDEISHHQLKFNPIGYSPKNGIQQFYFPTTYKHGHWSLAHRVDTSFTLFNNNKNFPIDEDHKIDSVNVECKNLQTIMEEFKWNEVDILKTDIEGLWWEFGQELLEKNIDFKYWVTEIEFNVGYSNDEILDKIEELCEKFKNKGYEIYTNRIRDNKRVCELIFILPLFK